MINLNNYIFYNTKDIEFLNIWKILYLRHDRIQNNYYLNLIKRFKIFKDKPPTKSQIKSKLKKINWEVVFYNDFVNSDTILMHLSKKEFPITLLIRNKNNLDYSKYPDFFTSVYCQIPFLFNKEYSDILVLLGQIYVSENNDNLLMKQNLKKLYWHFVEKSLFINNNYFYPFGRRIIDDLNEFEYSKTTQNKIYGFHPVIRSPIIIDKYNDYYYYFTSFSSIKKEILELKNKSNI